MPNQSKIHPHERLSRLLWWPLLALALALAACGPGSGGTGVGPVQGMVFSFSGNPGLPGGTPGSVTPPACTTDCDRADLRLDTARVEFSTACRRFVADGAWAVDATGLLVLSGTLETRSASGTSTTRATLRLQFSDKDPAASTQVIFTLLGERDTVLLGPTAIQRSDSQATGAPPACVPR